MASAVYQRVAHALAVTRETKLAFPSVLMEIRGRHAGEDVTTLTVRDEPLFRDGSTLR